MGKHRPQRTLERGLFCFVLLIIMFIWILLYYFKYVIIIINKYFNEISLINTFFISLISWGLYDPLGHHVLCVTQSACAGQVYKVYLNC